jgi:hypothetical protein
MKPKNVSTAPASANAAALTNLSSMEVVLHDDDDKCRPLELDGQRRRFSVEVHAWHAPHSCLALTGKSARSGPAKSGHQRASKAAATA